ncbi:Protein adenylyltransferase SelO [Camellia lanceoleosa]|uniref:Protein adenylyltransferase SelO n=1 Tax=Camellia lanceoleosa TaxID=1840588 RepID=A0ACC0F9F7_9ERIC|nr:Protein adenylyltransferase SelO [Camellia lanceoleosa]
MVSHLLASLSHSSLAAVVHLRPLFTPFSFSKPPTSLLLSSTTTKSLRKFHLYPSNCGKLQQRPSPSYNIVSDSSRSVSMDSPSISTDLSVDSVADDLKKQSLGDENVKLNLEDLNWDNSFVRELPGDPRADNIPRQVLHACYTKVSPSVEVENPQLVAWSKSVAELLDLDPKEFERPDFPLLFSGASPLVGAVPYAQCYGGHQFGTWAGQLGDGRAITLGEVLNSKSERWELQLKGAGKTPYSRFADGLAVLRSSIREFLCSEAMQSLGIPTTRALCLVATGKYVTRDMFYDGNPKDEPGAIVCRVAQSFLRFGSYQIHASRGKDDLDIVRTLADYTIRHHFPHIENMSKSESLSFNTGMEDDSVVDLTSNKYAAWAVEVAERTASLVASWQGVGFTHGVLNTDNMSVLGLTIDYGPFGFLDAFDPSYTPNTTDLPGRRYCFANQPDIGLWNIAQFASTLSAAQLVNDKETNYVMERYGTKFMDEYQAIMTKKLGLPKYNKQLISKLLNNMAVDKVDYTNFFRLLSNIKADPSIPQKELLIPLKAVLLDIGKERKEAWNSWVQSYIEELSGSDISDGQRKASMDSVNPKYILRNYLCQSAIDTAEQGDFGEVHRLLKVMERPYDEQPGMEKYARLPPAWAYRPGVGMLSCSS